MTPRIAEAATVAGEAMYIRALASPILPLKLRVDAVMHVSFAPSIPMCVPPHAPHVEAVTTAPALASVVIIPASLAARYTLCDAGVTMNHVFGCTRWPRTTSAASARSCRVPFAHEPTNA